MTRDRTTPGGDGAGADRTGASSPVRLIARREIVARWQQRAFRIGLAVAVVIVALAALAPRVFRGVGDSTTSVGVSGSRAPDLATAIGQEADSQGLRVDVTVTSPEEAQRRMDQGSWDAAIIDETRIVAKVSDSRAVGLLQAAYQAVATVDRLGQAGLTGAQIQQALGVGSLPVTATRSAQTNQRRAVATITVVFLFTQLIAFCTWMAMGVVEEKTSRVVELLLSAVRPLQLLTGKLLGIGALAMFQVLLIGGVALGIASSTGSLDVPASVYLIIASSFLWFVLGFAFFASVSAALASLVSRQEEVSGVMTPVTSLLLVSYLGSFVAANSPDSTLARVLSLLPPVSAIAMPARTAGGDVSALEVVLAAGLMVAATVAILALAARIYRVAVLHSGNRLTLRRAWQGEAVAERI
jgi:ABC-2 type transport system permease protein